MQENDSRGIKLTKNTVIICGIMQFSVVENRETIITKQKSDSYTGFYCAKVLFN